MTNLPAIEAYCDEIPEGPWNWAVSEHGPATIYDNGPGFIARVKESLPLKEPIARFICHARTDLPVCALTVKALAALGAELASEAASTDDATERVVLRSCARRIFKTIEASGVKLV